jgi:hypothetical protein
MMDLRRHDEVVKWMFLIGQQLIAGLMLRYGFNLAVIKLEAG